MGEELSLAREEEEGRPMLLAITGSGESIHASYRRDPWTQEPTPSKASSGGETKDTETKSKGSSKTQRANARRPGRPKGYRRDNKNRKSDRGDEGEDSRPGRTAQELGIIHPSSYCDELGTVPHYWIENDKVAGGSLYQCKFCRRHLWLPLDYINAQRLGSLLNRYGKDEGYCLYLNLHRVAKVLMAKLQGLRRLEIKTTDKREFARLADKILSDKEYDRKE